MNHTITLALAIILLAATGRGQSQTNQVMLRLEKLESSMKGQMTTNMVCTVSTVNELGHTNVDVITVIGAIAADASISVSDDVIRKLAASGEICKVFGFHCWGTDWLSAVQLVYYPDGQPQSRKCRICGKIETYKGEWK